MLGFWNAWSTLHYGEPLKCVNLSQLLTAVGFTVCFRLSVPPVSVQYVYILSCAMLFSPVWKAQTFKAAVPVTSWLDSV